MLPCKGEVTCVCCGGVFDRDESLGGYPFASFCLHCESGCKTACKSHKGHDLRVCRVEGCFRSSEA